MPKIDPQQRPICDPWRGIRPNLEPCYDLDFFDGYSPMLGDLVAPERLLRPGGLLVSANKQVAGGKTAACHARFLDEHHWLGAPLGDGSDMLLSIRQDVR